VDAPVYERGFHTAAMRDGVVQGVDPNGPAFAAGLRNGMRIIRRESGRTGDPTAPLAYRVDDHGVQRVISYLPIGRSHATEQRIVLAKTMTPEKVARCTRVLAGEIEPAVAPTPGQPALTNVAAVAPAQPLSADRVVQPSTLYSGQTPAAPVTSSKTPK
jgi:hypothetical protein